MDPTLNLNLAQLSIDSCKFFKNCFVVLNFLSAYFFNYFQTLKFVPNICAFGKHLCFAIKPYLPSCLVLSRLRDLFINITAFQLQVTQKISITTIQKTALKPNKSTYFIVKHQKL